MTNSRILYGLIYTLNLGALIVSNTLGYIIALFAGLAFAFLVLKLAKKNFLPPYIILLTVSAGVLCILLFVPSLDGCTMMSKL